MVALSARVEEGRLSVGGQCPAQDADVVGLLAGLEDSQHLAVGAAQLEEVGLAVVAVEGGEFPEEGRVVEQAGHGVVR